MKNKLFKWLIVIGCVCIIGTSGVTMFNSIKTAIKDKTPDKTSEDTAQVQVIDE